MDGNDHDLDFTDTTMDSNARISMIQQNIKNFGGDPESVTMFGYRTGASCIHFLMQSPAAVAGWSWSYKTSNIKLVSTTSNLLINAFLC